MKKKVIYLFVSGFIFLVALYIYMHQEKEYPVDSNKTVYVFKKDDNYQLIRNGKPFYIKGASGNSHIKALAEAGANTLRLYDTINLKYYLDEAQKYNIAVIVDILLPWFKGNSFAYLEDQTIEEDYIKIKKLVKKHKDHPALLFWNLGNEIDYPLTVVGKKSKLIKVFNNMIDLIHKEDPNHPVGTCFAGVGRKLFSINRNSPQIDLIGLNCFSSISVAKKRLKVVSSLTSMVPYYYSEWGVNGPWEDYENNWGDNLEYSSTQKGEVYKNVYNSYIRPDDQSLGSLAFYWGFKYEGTQTWFNVFDAEGRKSQAYYSLKSVWMNNYSYSDTLPPTIKEFKLDNKIDNNLVFTPNQMIEADVYIGKAMSNNLDFEWEIFTNNWGEKEFISTQILDMTQPYDTVLMKNNIRFETPVEEGAYRLAVNICDTYDNFATINIPFYVLNPKK